MFIQGTPLPSVPIACPMRRRRRPSFQRPVSPDAQRLRLLLQMVDARVQAESMIRDLVQVTAAAAMQAASILQQALYNSYIRVQCLLKTTTKEIISNIDAPSRFQRFMGGATSFLHDSSASQHKFEALESELQMLKEQMALLLQGQSNIASANASSSLAASIAPPRPSAPSIPVAPPAPPCPSVTKPPPASYTKQTISLLDELICSDVSDSESDDSDFDVKYRFRAEGMPLQPVQPNFSQSRSTAGARSQKQPSFAEQIQERNRVGLKKTRIDRSPGGTPLKRSSIPGSDGFHQEILANALFRKFQNVRADESPERRPSKVQERRDSLTANGLASLFEGEVQDDEWVS